MSSIATIEPKGNQVGAKSGESATFSFTVNNTTGSEIAVGHKILTDDPSIANWFTVEGAEERTLGIQEMDQVDIRINIPKDAQTNDYKFRLMVFSMQAPGKDFTEGPEITLNAISPVTPENNTTTANTGTHWSVWVAIAAVVISLFGGGGYFLYDILTKSKPVPDITGLTIDEAKSVLLEAQLTIDETNIVQLSTGQFEDGQINSQTPAANEDAPESKSITVTVEETTISVPSVIGMVPAAAKNILRNSGLALSTLKQKVSNAHPPGVITDQSPKAGQTVKPNSKVSIIIAKKATQPPTPTPTPTPTPNLETKCFNLVQNKVAYNKAGNKTWNPKNIKDLCKGTSNPASLIKCFKAGIKKHNSWQRAKNECKCFAMVQNKVAHDKAGHTLWNPVNVRSLCSKTKNPTKLVQCFKSGIAAHNNWKKAIQTCSVN